jgi:hypothetical protein
MLFYGLFGVNMANLKGVYFSELMKFPEELFDIKAG